MFDYEPAQALQQAKLYYSTGNLQAALTPAQKAVTGYQQLYNGPYATEQIAYAFLDAVTLLQNLYSLLHKPDAYLELEPPVQQLMQDLFPDGANAFYAVHLFDACESMAINNYLVEARACQRQAITYLTEGYGENTYTAFMDAYCNARIAFQIEDYYGCIDAASLANSLWYTDEYGQAFPPFLERNSNNEASVDRVGYNNLLLMCNAYGKINNPRPAINLLTEMLAQNIFQDYQLLSAEITLAQLYAMAQDYTAAKAIYEKYATSGVHQYPDLAAALEGLAIQLQQRPVLPPPGMHAEGYCYSHDALTISRYNKALGLAAAGYYEEALTEFNSLGPKGYSMVLALSAKLNKTNQIACLQEKVNTFYYRRAEEILLHYNEELAFNHLAQLQYHIDLCLGAYCHCCTGESPVMDAADAYSFLLNTKYLALEGSSSQNRPVYRGEDICSGLPRDTFMLEYTIYRDMEQTYYGVFLISHEDIRFVPLDTCKNIDTLLAQWHSLLQNSVQATGKDADLSKMEQRALDTRLRQALFLPLKPYLKDCPKLIIAAAGTMVNFPFCRLSVSARDYLGDLYSIRYLDTGKEMLLAGDHRPESANTIYFDSDTTALIIGNPETHLHPRLPYAGQEADMAGYFLHSHPYKDAEADIALFQDTPFAAPDYLHIAAHGEFAAISHHREGDWDALYEAMTHSGIVLAEDKLLSLTEIRRLDLTQTRLAILSCCHSGQGTYQTTEGTFGLRRVLRMAGCRALIVSLWQVDDAASCLWMQHFYQSYTIGGYTIADAFDHAIKAVREYEQDGIYPFSHPYYWAGYLLLQ